MKRRRTRRSLRVAKAIARRRRGWNLYVNWLAKACFVDVVSGALNDPSTSVKSMWR